MNTQKHERLAIILALAFFALAAVRVDAQVLILIPREVVSNNEMKISADAQGNPVGLVALKFQTDAMPPAATITRATLVMYCSDRIAAARQTISVYAVRDSVPGGPSTSEVLQLFKLIQNASPWPPSVSMGGAQKVELKLLSSVNLPPGFGKGEAAKWRPSDPADLRLLGNGPEFALVLGTLGGNEGRQWFGLSEQDTNHQPRLIIEYTTKNQPAVAQPVSVQSAKSFLPPNTPITYKPQPHWTPPPPQNPQTSYQTLDVLTSGAWSYAPAFRDNFVYLMTDEKPKKFLSWRRPLGAIIGQPIELTSNDPGQHLLVSESGRLYVVGQDKIIPFQIGADGTPALRTVRSGAKDTTTLPVTGLNPDELHAPTMGADGSMFYVSGTPAEGWTVVGRNPDLQELWKVPVGKNEPSRVTIGPSGQYVYLTTADDGLITIDARTGEEFKNSLPIQKLTFLYAPVVIRNPGDGIEKVYVAARSTGEGILTLFNNGKTKTRTPSDTDDVKWDKTIAAETVAKPSQWTQLDGLVGQPLVGTDNKRVYVVRVKDGTAEMVSLDWLTGAPNQSKTFTVGMDKPYLLNGGNLATDKDGNIFVWNGDSETHFKGFTPSLVPLFNDQLVDPQSESNLFFGTDGTLYVGAIGANANLRAILPQYKLNADSSASISSPTNLRVDGTAAGGKKWTLSASGSVLLGNGFTVNQTATLNISTGVP